MLRAFLLSCVLVSAVMPSALAPKPLAHAPQVGLGLPPTLHRWLQIRPHGEEFSFQMPVAPRLYVSQREDELSVVRIGGTEVTRELTYHAYYDGAVYLVHLYKASSPEKVLNGLLAPPNFRGVFVRNLRVDGNDVQEYETKYEGLYEQTHFIKSGKVIYELEAAARDANNPTLEKFLSSFKTGKPNPTTGSDVSAVGGEEGVTQVQPAAAPVVATPEATEQVLKAKEVTRKAVVIYKPEPLYTEQARREQLTGSVRINLVLSANGDVTNAKIEYGLKEGLSESSLEALRAIQFLPAEKDGRRVSQYASIIYNFNIY